jgi:hypothetical protein
MLSQYKGVYNVKYSSTLEIDTEPDEIIGAKEQIASAFENIGAVRITEIKESK